MESAECAVKREAAYRHSHTKEVGNVVVLFNKYRTTSHFRMIVLQLLLDKPLPV